MKYKTFRYNEIIKFFQDYGLPLTKAQIALIGTMVREEVDARDKEIEEGKVRRIIKKERRENKREKRKQDRNQNTGEL